MQNLDKPSNLEYKSHQNSIVSLETQMFLSRLAAVFAQVIEARR